MGALRQYNAEWQGWQLDAINASLEGASPRTIALWALAQRLPTMVSTSFGRDAAALLHLISELAPEMPAIWVDTGFATAETRDFAHQLTERLDLNLQTYRPAQPAISVLHEFGVSDPLDLADADREGFVQQVKLQPFQRAVDEWQPKIWLTGIRAEETEFRRGLAPVTLDERGILKVAPFFAATQSEVEQYLAEHELPRNIGYFDPTKPAQDQECGLHR